MPTGPRASAPSPGRRRLPLLLLLGALAAALVAGACASKRAARPPARRAFYYWRTQWSGAPALAQGLAQSGASRLYLRLFDVDWDGAARAALPLSPLQLSAPLPAVEIVPVVFLKNRVFAETSDAGVEALGEHVLQKILAMAEAAALRPREVQLDCDWSDGTRARYFHFLRHLRGRLRARGAQLSATIRLHQIKYAARTGVPPVDRGMLMLYNFGPLRADAERSSIFNVADAERYTPHIARYALPLDLALPLFSWGVHSRDGGVIGLLEKLDAAEVEATGAFRGLRPGRYEAARSLYLHGRYFREGDELLLEETTPEVTRQAAAVAARGAGPERPYGTIAFFDLDERNLRRYAPSDLQAILAALR